MRKAVLVAVGLIFICIPVFAGSYLTNDTGQTVYGLTVTFSELVTITSFGDELTEVNPAGEATEFIFSSGQVSTSGGQWFNWKPTSAQLLSHEWLLSDLIAASRSSETIEHLGTSLPRSITTHFAVATPTKNLGSLPPLEFFTTPASSYTADDSLHVQPIDGFTAGSDVPLDWWYSFSGNASNPTFTSLTPTGGSDVIYQYPEDGNIGHCTLRYKEPIDLSMCDGIKIIASSDHPVDVYVSMNICDAAVHPEPDEDYSCGQSSVTYPMPIHVTEDSQVFILPFSGFEISEWLLNSDAPVTMTPQFYGVTEISFNPDDEEGTLEIHKVSSVTQTIPVQLKGPEINKYYFQHPACVMQGVNDLDAIYALPLEGIPELGTGYAAIDPDSEELMWMVETSGPGIDAGFDNDTLYIWGTDASWAGYGHVTLKVTDETSASDSITIPVTVFKQDKTLINSEGVKEYYIPWGVELDINRILSVEEHMRQYDKDDLGLLDRTLKFSPWMKMEFLKDVTFFGDWFNSYLSNGSWNQESQFALVDVLLFELLGLGVNSIRLENIYYLESLSSSEIVSIFNQWNAGPTKSPQEESYIVNEAHRLGLTVLISNLIGVDSASTGGVYHENWEASPDDPIEFWENNKSLTINCLERWVSNGVEFMGLGNSLEYIGPNSFSNRNLTNTELINLALSAKEITPGPILHIGGVPSEFIPGQYLLDASFWKYYDILSVGILMPEQVPLATTDDPTVDEVVGIMKRWIDIFYQPFQARFNKPFLPHENGCPSYDGAIRNAMYSVFTNGDSSSIDLTDMSIYYLSHMIAYETMEGYFGPGWYFMSFNPFRLGGIRDWSANPRLKVEDEIRSAFLDSNVVDRISLDGSLNDWVSIKPQNEEELGDSIADDIINVKSFESEDYFFINVNYALNFDGPISILFDIDGDGREDYKANCNNSFNEYGVWQAFLYSLPNQKLRVGFGDLVQSQNGFEFRIHKRFFNF
jgi:hypothetical protein